MVIVDEQVWKITFYGCRGVLKKNLEKNHRREMKKIEVRIVVTWNKSRV